MNVTDELVKTKGLLETANTQLREIKHASVVEICIQTLPETYDKDVNTQISMSKE